MNDKKYVQNIWKIYHSFPLWENIYTIISSEESSRKPGLEEELISIESEKESVDKIHIFDLYTVVSSLGAEMEMEEEGI